MNNEPTPNHGHGNTGEHEGSIPNQAETGRDSGTDEPVIGRLTETSDFFHSKSKGFGFVELDDVPDDTIEKDLQPGEARPPEDRQPPAASGN